MQPINDAFTDTSRPLRAVPASFSTAGTCVLIANALDPATCARLVLEATGQGFLPTGADYPPSYRDNDRLVRDDPPLGSRIFDRLRAALPDEFVDAQGDTWKITGLNERFRFCRYAGGQHFRVHRDGAHSRSPVERSRFTLQIYLDDASTFTGGRTRFFASRQGTTVGAIEARTGLAIMFDHDFWHDGEPVGSGTKHVLRTDVMYRKAATSGDSTCATLAVLREHTGYVYRVAALSDGSLATASRDRTIRRWQKIDGRWRSTAVLPGHAASVLALCESSPSVLFSGSRDHTVRRWDLRTGSSCVVATHDGAVLCLEALDGGRTASGSGDATIGLFDDGGLRTKLAGHSGWVWALASLGDELLASGSEDGSIRLWDTDAGTCVAATTPGRGPVHALARLEDGTMVAGFADGHLITYAVDAQRGRLDAVQIIAAHDGEVYALCAAGGGRVASAGEDDLARVFRPSDGQCERTLLHDGFVRSIARLDDATLATGSYDGAIRVWHWCGGER